MRRAGAGIIVAAILALAGCKNTDPKSGDDKGPFGFGASRPKSKDNKSKDSKDGKDTPAKGVTWLDDVGKLPGAGTGIPKPGGPTNPKDPNFDAKTAAQDALGGRVLDPNGKPARNIFVRIEQVGAAAGGPAEIGIYTNNEGYFFSTGFKAGKTYEVTASATPQEGKPLTGSVQTQVPNAILVIVLRDDLPPPAAGFPPVPKPADKVGENIPPVGVAPINQPKVPGDAWSPGGPTTGVPPATIGGAKPPATGGPVPPPDDLVPSPKPVKPENIADGPKDPFKPPPASIPNPNGPPVPPLPVLPPPFNPTGGGRSSMDTNAGRAAGKFTLLDTLERPWESDSVRPGTLVLVEFMTSSCVPCKKAIPVLKDLQSRYGASGLQIAGVVCDELPQKERAATAAKYHRDHNLNYALYVEPVKAGSVRDRFDVEEYPHAVLLDAAGKVLWKGHPGERVKLEAAIKQNLSK